jgi:hypothetical protein
MASWERRRPRRPLSVNRNFRAKYAKLAFYSDPSIFEPPRRRRSRGKNYAALPGTVENNISPGENHAEPWPASFVLIASSARTALKINAVFRNLE